jgi:hypothetical protein
LAPNQEYRSVKRALTAFAVLVSLTMLPSGGATAAETASRIPASTQGMSDLEVLTHFFVPLAPIEIFMLDACETGYRTRLETVAEERELEEKIPGIHQAMIISLAGYCAKTIPPLLDTMHADARTRVSRHFTSAEIARLSKSFRSSVDEVLKYRVEVRDGDTVRGAYERAQAERKGDRSIFERAQRELIASPGGPALTGKVAAFQKDVSGTMKSGMESLAPVLAEGLKLSRRAGNDYAAGKGFANVYHID